MSRVDWTPVIASGDPDAQWQYFAGQALLIPDTLAPAKRFKVCNPTAPPISEATKDLMAQRRAYLHNGDRDRYKTLNRLVRAAIREDTRLDLRRRTQDSGRGDIWRCIQPVISGKQTTRPVPSADVETMNVYFAGVGTQTAR